MDVHTLGILVDVLILAVAAGVWCVGVWYLVKGDR